MALLVGRTLQFLNGELQIASLLSIIISVSTCCFAGCVIYNLTLHPLAKFSGPLLGNAFPINLYSFYFDVVSDGQLYHQLPSLHKRYGPVLRLGANELWFNDPHVHGDIYGRKTRLMKAPRFYQTQALGLKHSLPYTCNLDDHRHLRSLFEKYWTKSAILKRQSMIWDKVELFCEHLAKRSVDGREVCFHDAFRKVVIDIATEFSWNKALGELKIETDKSSTTEILDSSGFFQTVYHFPILRKIIEWIGPKFLDSAEIRSWENSVEAEMRCLIDNEDSNTGIKSTTLATRYRDFKGKSKSQVVRELTDEAITLIAAGSEGPSSTLVFGIFYLLKDPDRLSRLLEELKTVMPSPSFQPSFDELKLLPYFAAVMKESLRLSYGASTLPRIVPKDGTFIGDTFVPGGVTVQMSNYVIHNNEILFPEPSKFIPERFLGEDSRDLDKHLLNFSAGPAKCLGIELAQIEMHIITAALIRRFEIIPKTDLSAYTNMPWADHSLPVLVQEKLCAHVRLRSE